MDNRLEELASQLDKFASAQEPALEVTGKDGLVRIRVEEGRAHVTLDRSLAPRPDDRAALEASVAAAVDALVAQRSPLSTAFADALVPVMREQVAGPQQQLDEDVAALKERIAGLRARNERIRSMRG